MNILFAWIGHTDLRASQDPSVGVGPIAQALKTERFDLAVLLDNYEPGRVAAWRGWLESQTKTRFEIRRVTLSGPTAFREVYAAAVDSVLAAKTAHGENIHLTFHLSPGTSAMAAVWLLLAKARFNADLIESSREQGVQAVDVPFDIAADFLPDLQRQADARVAARLAATPPTGGRFGDIVYRSDAMARVIARAEIVSLRSVPVLLLGESGTGKELLARAIHAAGPRQKAEFVAVNCGAIPTELIESELFGHERGAFTGAIATRPGVFERADGGTLFLDEIGELPLAAQVKLLRTLQDGEVQRVGGTKSKKVNVRIVAATHRDLLSDAKEGRFREDLFYRLAVAMLHIPPLRDRAGDMQLLVDHLWEIVTTAAKEDRSWKQKELSAGARRTLLAHDWPGNVRELLNTLHRLALWSEGEIVTAEDVRDALLTSKQSDERLLNRTLGEGLSLPDLLAELARHYLLRAMAEAGGNKTRAAELVGLASYQTLSNWLEKYGVALDGSNSI